MVPSIELTLRKCILLGFNSLPYGRLYLTWESLAAQKLFLSKFVTMKFLLVTQLDSTYIISNSFQPSTAKRTKRMDYTFGSPKRFRFTCVPLYCLKCNALSIYK